MICVHCDFDFDPRGTRKILAGGKINECADCVEELGTETAVKYLGCASADGKMGGVSIRQVGENFGNSNHKGKL